MRTIHLQRLAGGLLGEFVGAVAGADGDGQRVEAGELYEFLGLRRIGEVAEAVEAGAVAVFDTAQTADLAFHRDALGVRHLDDLAGGIHVVLEGGRRLAIGHQRAIHHDAGEAHVNGALAGFHAIAVVEVQDRGDLGVNFGGGDHQVIQEAILRISARTAAGLNDDRRLGFPRRFHDRLGFVPCC